MDVYINQKRTFFIYFNAFVYLYCMHMYISSLLSSVRGDELACQDCDGVVNASDTRERWEEILQPLIARFGDGVQVPRGSDCRNA